MNNKKFPIEWPKHENVEHKRCIQDNGFMNWVERNIMVIIAVVGVGVVTVMTTTGILEYVASF